MNVGVTIGRRSLASGLGMVAVMTLGAALPATAAIPASTVAEQESVTSAERIELVGELAAVLDPDVGSARLATGYADLVWDSTVASTTRAERFGPGWTWGTPYIQDGDGGSQLYLPGRGLHAVDLATASGIAGDLVDVRFTREAGLIPARPGVVAERSFSATLRWLATGAIDYFDGQGNVITSVETSGRRIDREFGDPAVGVSERHLRTLIDADGGVTTVKYTGRTKVTRADGAFAQFALDKLGGAISWIDTVASDTADPRAFNIQYEPGLDGIHRVSLLREMDRFYAVPISQAYFEWGIEAPDVIGRIDLDGRYVYERG